MESTGSRLDPLARTQFLLRKLIVQNGEEVIASHRWLWEKDRWKELVFSIVSRAGGLTERDAHVLVDQMDALGLISVRKLADIDGKSGDPNHAIMSTQISELFA